MMLRRFCLLFLLLISTLATAEKYALLVGINDYQNDIGALKVETSRSRSSTPPLLFLVSHPVMLMLMVGSISLI